MLRFFVFLLFLAVAGGAFYGGMRYQTFREGSAGNAAAQSTPLPVADRTNFESRRATLDADPQKWLADNLTVGSKPLDSKDPEFLYLYGRALMLTGSHREASQAFGMAIANLRAEPKASLPLSTELKLAEALAALKQRGEGPGAASQEAILAERKAVGILDGLLGMKGAAVEK